MTAARLTQIRLRRFKSWLAETRLAWMTRDDLLDRLRAGVQQTSEIKLHLAEIDGIVSVPALGLKSEWTGVAGAEIEMSVTMDLGRAMILSSSVLPGVRGLAMDHFLPYLAPLGEDEELDDDSALLGFSFGAFYAEPLRVLKDLLSSLSFVASSREEIPPYYAKSVGLPGRNVLPGGGNAPELLYSRQGEQVHLAPMAGVRTDGTFALPEHVVERSLKGALQNLDADAAEEFFRSYKTRALQVSEILRTQGLW